MYRDLLYFYGIDLVAFVAEETRYTPRLLLSLIERLPEGSEYIAEIKGNREFRDWDLQATLSAALVNAVNTNTLATGNWKPGHVPKIEPITGPVAKPEPKEEMDPEEQFNALFQRLQQGLSD